MTKAQIFNLALGALLLQRTIVNTETDQSNECSVLNTHWDVALDKTLADLDLDATSTQAVLALNHDFTEDEDPEITLWDYAYTYPDDCVKFRRIQSEVTTDNRYTHIKKRTQIFDDVKVIFSNEIDAIAEYITNEVPLSTLSADTGMAIAYRLAHLSAPLIVGKGATELRKEIWGKYLVAKAEAQENDIVENFSFEEDDISSEFVAVRTS